MNHIGLLYFGWQQEDLLLAQEEDLVLAQEEDLPLAQEEDAIGTRPVAPSTFHPPPSSPQGPPPGGGVYIPFPVLVRPWGRVKEGEYQT